VVLVNTTQGLTHTFDPSAPSDLATLSSLLAGGQATAVSLLHDGVRHVLPGPRGFRRHFFGAEVLRDKGGALVGERVFVRAGDIRVSVSLTYKGGLVRTDVARIGALKYNLSSKRRACGQPL